MRGSVTHIPERCLVEIPQSHLYRPTTKRDRHAIRITHGIEFLTPFFLFRKYEILSPIRICCPEVVPQEDLYVRARKQLARMNWNGTAMRITNRALCVCDMGLYGVGLKA